MENKIKIVEPKNNIIFSANEDGEYKEIMRLEKGKFIWKGQEIDDVNKIYERFSEWMGLAEKTN